MYLNMFGTDMVVLNSSETIADLLDKRSAIYSDKVATTPHPPRNMLTRLGISLRIASVTNGRADGPGQVGVHDVSVRREVENTPPTLSRVFQCCDGG